MNNAYENEQLKQQQIDKQRQHEQAVADDFRAVASTQEGRRLIRRVVDECGIFHSTYTDDALLLAHKEGRRTIGLFLMEGFATCPDLHIKFLTEK